MREYVSVYECLYVRMCARLAALLMQAQGAKLHTAKPTPPSHTSFMPQSVQGEGKLYEEAWHPALDTCQDLLRHVEAWALLKLPLLSGHQAISLCNCYSLAGVRMCG